MYKPYISILPDKPSRYNALKLKFSITLLFYDYFDAKFTHNRYKSPTPDNNIFINPFSSSIYFLIYDNFVVFLIGRRRFKNELCLLAYRKLHDKRRALPRALALGADRAPVRLGDLFRDEEPVAGGVDVYSL